MRPRLDNRTLLRLPAKVERPGYDRGSIGAGIVHLGVGAFHRAHQAWYTERALQRDGGDWGIVAASLRSADVAGELNPQNGLYTLVVRDGTCHRHQVIGAIRKVLVAPEDPEALIAQLAAPAIRVVTLTITEKGYFYSHGRGGLLLDSDTIREDLARFPDRPATAIGFLASALQRRRQQGAGGLTLMSCDNLPHNGLVLATVVRDFVRQVDPSLLHWIDANVTFPSTMVDRIVPAATAEDLADLAATLGVEDRGAVFTEPFSQWVIEDNFARGAPDWRTAGALYTRDVGPFETMKLRLLNGSHSLMAYLGYLAGFEYVHQVVADKHFLALVRAFMDHQAQPTLRVPEGFDISGYKNDLCRRFANPALNHRLYQIAQDGSQKLPQRWLAPLRELLDQREATNVLALALAGWLRYLEGERDSGEPFAVDDPLGQTLERLREEGGTALAVLHLADIFGDLADVHPRFVDIVEGHYHRIKSAGVKQAVAAVVEGL